MKKVTYLGLGLALGLVALTASGSFAAQKNTGKAGIVGSSHDLSGIGLAADGGDVQQRICVFCHHPHNSVKADAAVNYSPLWNRGVPSGFSPYNNSNVAPGTAGSMMGNASSAMHMMNGTPQFAGVSLLCMSCHDGTTAMNAYSDRNTDFNGGAGTGIAMNADERNLTAGGAGAITTTAALAGGVKNMSNHHPVGMLWADSEMDPEIAKKELEFKNSATGVRNSGITIASVLSQSRMECVTCHDVHNSGNEAGAERFLWVSDKGSNFCLSCHLK